MADTEPQSITQTLGAYKLYIGVVVMLIVLLIVYMYMRKEGTADSAKKDNMINDRFNEGLQEFNDL